MRIMDWSSDVCCSDLLGAVDLVLLAHVEIDARMAERAAAAVAGDHGAVDRDGLDRRTAGGGGGFLGLHLAILRKGDICQGVRWFNRAGLKIGRESWRERVGQSV